MFGLRSDGKKIKIKDPIFKIIPHIMNSRIASQNYMVEDIDCSSLDDFIRTKREEGISYNYMHIVIAGLARLFYIRDELNRFIMNGRFYQRYSKDGRNITIALTVKKFLGDGAPETIVKFSFKGDETLEEIKEIIDSGVKANTSTKEAALKEANQTEKTAKYFRVLPNSFMKGSVGLIKFMDKHGMLPKKLIEVSPFHCSVFLTNLKSIRTKYVFHHLYEFGTTSIFISMGKEGNQAVEGSAGELELAKIMQLGFTIDERITDGFYFAKSVKLFKKFLTDPSLLELPIDKCPTK